MGYAFINFINPVCILEFYEELNAKKWQRFNSEKICQITYGRLQGKKALVEHFDSIVAQQQGPQDRRVKPLILATNKAEEEWVKEKRQQFLD